MKTIQKENMVVLTSFFNQLTQITFFRDSLPRFSLFLEADFIQNIKTFPPSEKPLQYIFRQHNLRDLLLTLCFKSKKNTVSPSLKRKEKIRNKKISKFTKKIDHW